MTGPHGFLARLRDLGVRSGPVPALLWAAMIFVSSSIPSAQLPRIKIFNADKVVHFLIFAGLAFLIDVALRANTRFPLLRRRHLVFTILFTGLYGLTDEFHQHFVPGRDPSILDLLADITGALLYSALYWLWHRRRHIRTDAVR